MSDVDNPRDRLLHHLRGDGDEAERRRLEMAALEDDDFFDELRAAETELIDGYVQGELEEVASQRLAELVGRSRRLQESAETTLALHARDRTGRHGGPEPDVSLSAPSPVAAAPPAERSGRVLPAACGLLLVLALWQAVFAHLELVRLRGEVEGTREEQRKLETELELLERELEGLRREQLHWQRRWAEERGAEH